jgi:hypothetical protein
MKLSEIKANPNNPRLIKDDKFKKLVKSLESFPEMMEKRPIVCVTDVDGKLYPLGGNMRLKALIELKYKDIPDSWVTMADEWTEEQRREFLIKDNVGFGEWDWDMIANEWDAEQVEEWGLDVPRMVGEDDGTYTTKVESPIYEPKGEKPKESELYNLGKYNELMDKINASNLSDEKKLFLQLAATRHIEFNYGKIAEFYSHEDKEAQELMEDNALVIIDYNKAIELGFVKLFDDLEKFSEIDE